MSIVGQHVAGRGVQLCLPGNMIGAMLIMVRRLRIAAFKHLRFLHFFKVIKILSNAAILVAKSG